MEEVWLRGGDPAGDPNLRRYTTSELYIHQQTSVVKRHRLVETKQEAMEHNGTFDCRDHLVWRSSSLSLLMRMSK